jgi:hypothetical protein
MCGGDAVVLTIVYKVMLAYFIVLIVWDMLRSKDVWDQLCGAILVIPFFLRLLGLK